MTTIEKMYLIKELMTEVESEVRETANKVEDIDNALFRMLTEECADYFKYLSKNYHSASSGYRIETWSTQLNYAYNISKS